MSHSMLFTKFKDGILVAVEPKPVLALLARHGIRVGGLSEGTNEIRMPVDETGDTPIGELAVHVASGAITEISIDRPRYKEPYRLLAFDLLTEGFAMFSDNGTVLYAKQGEVANLPQALREQVEFADLDVKLPRQLE